MATTYTELLRDPRWQKKRLKKLEAAEWRCERCMDSETTLNVHHKRYVKGRLPWEYEDAELAVLCEPCHEEEHEQRDIRTELLARLAMDGPLGIDDFIAYGAGAISRYSWMIDPPLVALVEQIRLNKPFQFQCGRLGANVGELGIGNWTMTADVMLHIADLAGGDDEFGRDLLGLLQKYGVKIEQLKKGGD
jgi:hypothetical protein